MPSWGRPVYGRVNKIHHHPDQELGTRLKTSANLPVPSQSAYVETASLCTSCMVKLWFNVLYITHVYRSANTFNECLCVVLAAIPVTHFISKILNEF